MREFLLKWLLCLCCVLGASLAFADDVAPDALLSQVTAGVIAVLKQQQAERNGSTGQAVDLIENRILPHFDFTRMTKSAMARYWREATTEQQAALTAQFRTLLVHTYSNALAGYRDQAIEFKRLKASPADTEVIVNSIVRQAGHEPLPVDYAMAKTVEGWKVYDVRIAGISLVASYRDAFASRIRASGVDGLIKSLAEKNRPPA